MFLSSSRKTSCAISSASPRSPVMRQASENTIDWCSSTSFSKSGCQSRAIESLLPLYPQESARRDAKDTRSGRKSSEAEAIDGRLEEIRNAVKGDACGSSLVGREHGGGGDGAGAVLVVELIHCGEQARATLRVLKAVEEIQGVKTIGNETVELHSDVIRLVELRLRRAAGPEA